MSPLVRAVVGAAAGAILTLLIHPVSRSFITAIFHRESAANLTVMMEGRQRRLEPPSDLIQASVWIQVAAEKLEVQQGLEAKEYGTLTKILDQACKRDPDNAFWFQMRAVILNAMARPTAARQAWTRASRAAVWNDYQTTRLFQCERRIAERTGADQAWQTAYVYYARSHATPRMIERFSRTIVGKADFDSDAGLDARVATILNGNLLCLGARTIADGALGLRMIDIAAYPEEMAGISKPKRLYLGRNLIVTNLRNRGRDDEARTAQRIFQHSDGWDAMTQTQDPDENARTLAWLSILTASVPSLTMLFAAIGGFGYVIGLGVEQLTGSHGRLSPAPVAMCASALAAVVFALTLFPLAAAAAMLCLLFLTVGPKRHRRTSVEDLGPFFAFAVFMVAVIFTLVLGLYLIDGTTAATAVLPMAGVPDIYGGGTAFVGLALVVFGVLFLIAPSWALVHRVPTPQVLSLALRKWGAFMGVGCLVLAVLLGPLSIYADRKIGDRLTKIVGNEPVYYLLNEP